MSKYIIELPDDFKGEIPKWAEPYKADDIWRDGYEAGKADGIRECNDRLRKVMEALTSEIRD